MIKKVDFYILATHPSQSFFFVCQLLEKIYQPKHYTYVQVSSLDMAKQLDDLLWTYREDSFIPHSIYQDENSSSIPIQILIEEEGEKDIKIIRDHSIIVNLSQKMPINYKSADHIIEIVFNDILTQQSARERYRQYRDLGCEIHTHKEK